MNESTSYLAFMPRGPGMLCGVMSIVVGDDVYGWYTGPAGNRIAAAFFMLEHYYSTHETAFYHSVEDDVYSAWVLAWPPVEIDMGRSAPVPEEMRHELERAQDAFGAEWLFYCDDPAAADELAWYRARGLPPGKLGIQHDKLNRFDQGGVVWTHASAALDTNIIDFLRQRWPLDYALAP